MSDSVCTNNQSSYSSKSKYDSFVSVIRFYANFVIPVNCHSPILPILYPFPFSFPFYLIQRYYVTTEMT